MKNPNSTIADIKQSRYESWIAQTFGELSRQAEVADAISRDTMRGGVLRSRLLTTPEQALSFEDVKIDKEHGTPYTENSDGTIRARLDGAGHMVIELTTELNDTETVREKFLVYPEAQDQKIVRLDEVDGETQYDFTRARTATPTRRADQDSLGIYIEPGNEHYERLTSAIASEPDDNQPPLAA